MTNRQKILFSLFALMLVFSFLAPELYAQCPMCRMSAESNMANGGTAGSGLNSGILYMLAMPYIIIGTVAFIWYRNRKKNKEEEQRSETETALSDRLV